MSYVKMSVVTAMCIALCVVLPLVFHAIPGAGRVLLPMHIPVLLCGLMCGWAFGLFCGIAGPLLSSLFTGMPPFAFLPGMMVELAVYGLVSGIVARFVPGKRPILRLYASLGCAMIAGRVVAGVFSALLFARGNYSIAVWVTSYFVTSAPGIVIQLAAIPSIVFALESARLVPKQRAHIA